MIRKAQIEDFRIAIHEQQPIPNSIGNEGCGESCWFDDQLFYYPRVGKLIPRNRISYLVREHSFAGRTHGEKEYIVILPHETNKDVFYVLEHVYYFIRDTMKKYKGKSSMDEILPLFDRYESDVRCFLCGREVLLLGEEQPQNECFSCWEKQNKI